MRSIAIALNAGNPQTRNIITNFFAAQNWAYWHWIDDFWIVQVPHEYTPSALHERIETLPEFGTPTILVFEFHGAIGYWGRSDAAAWDWLNHIGAAS
ncbi:MAG: hypothetical protein KIS62_16255 [Ramlibacter sp.]|nr:hypothetical protein [Ramlibacter sp.]